jgi:3-methyladenine DNA glycosylase/8-oxoguanine DNA glycosylase
MPAPRPPNPAFARAQRHLARRDPVLRRLIGLVGPCTLRHDPDHFAVLVRSIISQQISTKAAASIAARLRKTLGRRGLRPAGILATPEEALRAAGLSTAKRLALRDLAEKVHGGQVPLGELAGMGDEEVIARLVPVRGIGRWTAEMFLIFSLGRLDVLPLADHGLRSGVRRHYDLAEVPTRDELVELAEPWRPYRSVATWFVWKSFGFVPQSDG